MLVHRDTGERAVNQVKSGGSYIEASRHAGEEKAFLFAASGNYGPTVPPNVVLVTRDELTSFMRDKPHLLSRAVSTWIEIASRPGGTDR